MCELVLSAFPEVADEGDLHARNDPGSFLEPVDDGEIPIGSTAITAFGVIV